MWYIIVGCFLFSACAGKSFYAHAIDNARVKRQNQQLPEEAGPQRFHYRPYNQAPDRIKHLLQAQQIREALVHIPVYPVTQLQPQPVPASKHQQEQPIQYTAKVQYAEAPAQPMYKGIQSVRPNPQQGLAPLHGQGPASQNAYTPNYKQLYSPQPAPNAVYRTAAPTPAQYQPRSPQPPQPPQLPQLPQLPQPPQSQFPKNLPPHIQKIIEHQRSFQG